MATWIWVNIGSVDVFLLDCTKALPEPKLTWHQKIQWHSSEISQPSITKVSIKSTSIKFHSNLPGANELSINSSPPSAAYTRQWIGSALVQIMACRLFGAKPLSEPMLGNCQLDPWEQNLWKSNWNSCIFMQENTLENVVCETVAILSRGKWIKSACLPQHHKTIHLPPTP